MYTVRKLAHLSQSPKFAKKKSETTKVRRQSKNLFKGEQILWEEEVSKKIIA